MSITHIRPIWTYGSRSPRYQHQMPISKYDVILYSLSPLKRCCLLPKLRQAELALLRLQHHRLERSYRPFQCLQLVPVLTTHPCALLCLYVWVRHCARRMTVSVEWSEWLSIQLQVHGVHGLSCRKSVGRGARDTAMNSIVQAHCPQRKYQIVLSHEDVLVMTANDQTA